MVDLLNRRWNHASKLIDYQSSENKHIFLRNENVVPQTDRFPFGQCKQCMYYKVVKDIYFVLYYTTMQMMPFRNIRHPKNRFVSNFQILNSFSLFQFLARGISCIIFLRFLFCFSFLAFGFRFSHFVYKHIPPVVFCVRFIFIYTTFFGRYF